MNIKTVFVCPPIPTRNHDWQAYVDGTIDGGDPDSKAIVGTGATEEEAIFDLLEQLDVTV